MTTPQKKPNVQPGDVVFFKTAKENTQRRTPDIAFKGGHAFGLVLGIVPPFMPEPTAGQIIALIGAVGFVSCDDIQEFLGKENMDLVLEKWKAKYTPKPKSELILPEPPQPENVS